MHLKVTSFAPPEFSPLVRVIEPTEALKLALGEMQRGRLVQLTHLDGKPLRGCLPHPDTRRVHY